MQEVSQENSKRLKNSDELKYLLGETKQCKMLPGCLGITCNIFSCLLCLKTP